MVTNLSMPLSVLVLLCVTPCLWLGGEGTAALLEYDRSRILAGEVWRLLSGNGVHLSVAHVGANVVGLLLIGALAARLGVAVPLVLSVICALTVGGGLLTLAPEVAGYRGLSGVLHGLLAFILGRAAINGDRTAAAAFVGLAALLCFEAVSGRGLLPGLAMDVIVEAHALGALAGVAALPWAVGARRLLGGVSDADALARS